MVIMEQKFNEGGIIPSGLPVFDSIFPIRRGTLNLFYTQNQTSQDGTQIAMHWTLNNLGKEEAVLFFTTFSDPVSYLDYYARFFPSLFNKIKTISNERKFFWIDNFSYCGFIEEDTRGVEINYDTALKNRGIKFDITIVKKPQSLDSVEGPFIAFKDIFDKTKSKTRLRIYLGRVDDLVDFLGEKKVVAFYRYLGSHIHKYGHTGIALMESQSQPPLIHRVIERASDQIVQLAFNDRNEKTPVKYFQPLKRDTVTLEDKFKQCSYQIAQLFPNLSL